MQNCDHKEWIGQPAGYIPLSWQCTECGMTLTAGEKLLYDMLYEQIKHKVDASFEEADELLYSEMHKDAQKENKR